MADKKISALTGASTPLAGTEVLPIVQSGTTVKVAVSDLTAGRNVSMLTAAVGNTLAAWNTFDKVTQTGAASTANYNNEDNTLWGSNVYYGGSPAAFRYISNGTACLLRQDGGNQYFLNAASGTAGAVITFTETFRIASTGNVNINNGNLVIGTSGKGIDFSATAGTGTSELLSDYEEGTVTVTAVCGTSGTITLSANRMAYTRVGRLVTLSGYLDVSSVSSPTGSLSIAGLPFTCASGGTGFPFNAAVTVFATGLTAFAITAMQGYVGGGTTSIVVQKFSAGASTDAAAEVQANSAFMLSVSYFTS